MKIIVDMMGGDNAPLAVLEGAAAAVKEYGVQLIGVGDEALVRKTAADNNISLDGIELVNCTEVIEMCDEPARAIRTKKDSSIVVGLNMLKEGKGDAFVSAGSTGALHVGASLIVRTLRGIKRPALATMVPAQNKAYLLLDCGANVECRPEMLAAFAVMGSCYVNKVEGRTSPSVALANNVMAQSEIEAGRLVCPFNDVLVSKNAFYLVCHDSQAELGKIAAFRQWILAKAANEQEKFRFRYEQ